MARPALHLALTSAPSPVNKRPAAGIGETTNAANVTPISHKMVHPSLPKNVSNEP